jgi:hypothetical protein
MNSKLVLRSALTCAVLAAGAAAFSMQEKKAAPAGGGQAADPMMAKWMEFASPGAAHKVLDPKVGKWTLKVKMFQPGQPTQESPGTSEMKWIMDGRYLSDTTDGSFMNMPFKGMGMTGYDNLKKKYVSTWVDNMGTGISYAEGTYDAASKTFTYSGQSPDVMAGKYVPSRMTEKWTDADHWTMQMFAPGADGKEMMQMQIDYARSK